ncbi:MAG: NADH-quinone oxidoreductase subunit E [Candidatus Marinimicrobia bacterium]|nr:NADH-quinone oxidoreductase subunit E [Candidatus Neomarinimicrobiota bacterium]
MAKQKVKRVDLIFKNCNCNEIIKASLKKPKEEIIQMLIDSELKGRGGAGFPTGLKWKVAAAEKSNRKYVICNADEGEPGTFKDREILDRILCKVLGGMALCAYVIGAREGFIYLRQEYRFLIPKLEKMLDTFHEWMEDFELDFTVKLFIGGGAYICGEETSLIESMEGRRGEPRNKPPYPTQDGYLGKPTVVNNVETFVYTMMIMHIGADKFKEMGVKGSSGSKLFSVSGDTPKAGIYEVELGMTLESFVKEFGDGDTKAVQVGGASGFCVPRKRFKETHIGYQGGLKGFSLPTGGSMMIFNSSRSMYNVLHNYLVFFEEESCGQCTPCRVGCQQLLKGVEAVKRGEKSQKYLNDLLRLAKTMKITAKCGLGQSVANSFSSIVENFREEMIY